MTRDSSDVDRQHAARLVRAAKDGMGYCDRTGQVRDPRPPEP